MSSGKRVCRIWCDDVNQGDAVTAENAIVTLAFWPPSVTGCGAVNETEGTIEAYGVVVGLAKIVRRDEGVEVRG